jgi:ferric-dicitrate binding protein FerR (iron transport regulator)
MENETLLKKWLNGELTPEEEKIFMGLDDYEFNQNIIESAKAFKASNFNEVAEFDEFHRHYSRHSNPVKHINWKTPFLRIASIVVIAISIYSAFYFNQTTRFETMATEKTSFQLPDASTVTLNSVSQISFDKRSWSSSRLVNLKGEAYFKVTKGNTFDVVTSSGIVTVIGTQFNVKQRQNFFYVECYEGIVSVNSDTIYRKLYAGDSFKIYNGTFTENHTDHLKPNWLNQSSNFHAIALKDVLSELERQYDVEITYKGIDVEKLFTGTFTHNDLDQALISITQPMNLNYTRNSSNRVVIYENKN